MPTSEFQRRLSGGERAFLLELRIEERDLDECLRLGPGAPLYLSEIFLALTRTATPSGEEAPPRFDDLEDTAEQLLALQWRRGASPWREEAALRLIRRYLATERYAPAESLAKQLLRRRLASSVRNRAQRDLMESLYWQQKDEAVLAALEQRKQDRAPWDDELDLYRAVSVHRLQLDGWRQGFIDLFFTKPTSGIHARAVAYLEQEDRIVGFEPAVSLFFQAKDQLYRSQNAEAIDSFTTALSALGPGSPDMGIVIRELGAAYFAAGRHREGSEALVDLSADLQPVHRLAAIEMAGRLLRKGGDPAEAQKHLLEVAEVTADAQQRDRVIWFLMHMAAEESFGQLLALIERFAPRWTDPWYFSDLLEGQISGVVARRDWDGLLSLHTVLKGYADPETASRLSYLAGRVLSLGLADAASTVLSPQGLYLEARSTPGPVYHRFLAEAALVELGFPVTWSLEENRRGDPGAAGNGPEVQPPAEVIRGYFDYGLYDTGTELLRSQWRSVSPQLLRDAALLLHDRSEFLGSIRLMNLYVRRKAGGPDRQDLELLYPRAYRQWVEEISRSENLPVPVFYALVREESYFDPQIVSRSGAVGLTQLMSETAADTARWLRMEQYDVRDPEQNLRLGARHYSRLLSRLEDVPKALMAYNAGLSRLRGWERSFAGLPIDLLAEAAPFPETRNYVRKILVSAVYYGALYYELSLDRTVFLFFPGIEQEPKEIDS